MNLLIRLLTSACLFVCCISPVFAQSEMDSVRHLREVTVTAKTYKEVIPAQKLSGKELQSLNSFSVADAIRYFAGVQIKDYGGIGGLKTVNIRSMGTNHMGVFYDGIQLGNAQNGQIDLGKFSLDNIEEISLYNGQKSEIFQPARDFGSAGTIYLRSRSPKFEAGKKQNLKFNLKTGSFHLVNPSFLWEQKISDKTSFSLNSEYIYSSGKYKFRYKRVHPATHETVYDTTAVRANGDINALRVESGLYGWINDGKWNMKAYFYNSERGIPGAIVNNVFKRSQRQWDRNFFTQALWQKSLLPKWDMRISAKYANDYMRYLNPDTTLMYIDNTFVQQELYFSSANKFAITHYWDASLSADLQLNSLTSNMQGFVFPRRATTLVAVASALDLGKVKMQGSLLATFVNEKISRGNVSELDTINSAPNKQEFTPAVFIAYKPFKTKNLTFRAFYKNIFRMPTFNDLYYTDIGNAYLKPEFTHQYNVGVHYAKNFNHNLFKSWDVQADGYFNQVTNKIIAVPKGSGMYRWMMMNLGYVEIRGIDFSSALAMQIAKKVNLNGKITYTFQKAQDFTPEPSEDLQKITWGGQIPYIPWHNGSAIMGIQYQSWRINYSFIYVGERYHNSANIRENYEQPWYTNDMSIVKEFKIKNYQCKASFEINNIFSQDYEVVLNYPMPKRNYKLILTFEI